AVSLIVTGVMIIIALGIASSSIQSRKASIGSSQSNLAFQNADSGVEVVMQKIKSASTITDIDPVSDLDGCNGIVNSSGKYKVELKKTDGTPVTCGDLVSAIDTIKSTGYSSQDSRAIEVAVAASTSTIESGVDSVSVAASGKQLCPRPGIALLSVVATAQQLPLSGTCNNCNALMKDFNNPSGCFTILLNRADTDAGDYKTGTFYWIATY
ncbi:MAG TPA: hypothetical protein VF390_02715, partial [Patescibacteria group bacterium]